MRQQIQTIKTYLLQQWNGETFYFLLRLSIKSPENFAECCNFEPAEKSGSWCSREHGEHFKVSKSSFQFDQNTWNQKCCIGQVLSTRIFFQQLISSSKGIVDNIVLADFCNFVYFSASHIMAVLGSPECNTWCFSA